MELWNSRIAQKKPLWYMHSSEQISLSKIRTQSKREISESFSTKSEQKFFDFLTSTICNIARTLTRSQREDRGCLCSAVTATTKLKGKTAIPYCQAGRLLAA
jgi:hypothetical protein